MLKKKPAGTGYVRKICYSVTARPVTNVTEKITIPRGWRDDG